MSKKDYLYKTEGVYITRSGFRCEELTEEEKFEMLEIKDPFKWENLKNTMIIPVQVYNIIMKDVEMLDNYHWNGNKMDIISSIYLTDTGIMFDDEGNYHMIIFEGL